MELPHDAASGTVRIIRVPGPRVDKSDIRVVVESSPGRPSVDAIDFATAIQRTLDRLVDEVVEAVDDGTWGAAEGARLHAWIRAELLPWAADMLRQASPGTRAVAGPALSRLAGLDAQLLGTYGASASHAASNLHTAATTLIRLTADTR